MGPLQVKRDCSQRLMLCLTNKNSLQDATLDASSSPGEGSSRDLLPVTLEVNKLIPQVTLEQVSFAGPRSSKRDVMAASSAHTTHDDLEPPWVAPLTMSGKRLTAGWPRENNYTRNVSMKVQCPSGLILSALGGPKIFHGGSANHLFRHEKSMLTWDDYLASE